MGERAGSAGGRLGAGMIRGVVLAAALAVAGCSPVYRNHGYLPFDEDLAGIAIGVDTRESVAERVGTPTAGGVLNDGGFYYVRSRFRHFAFLAPEEIDRQILAISFAADGTVSNIERFGLEDGQIVILSRRVTDDNLPSTSFLRQLFGSIGNFDAGSLIGENDVPR